MRYWREILLGIVLVPWASVVRAEIVVPFSGTIDPKAMTADVLFGREGGPSLVFHAARISPEKCLIRLDLSHVQTPLWDVATTLTGNVEFVGSGADRMTLAGEISSQYTLLDYKPVRDLYVKFSVTGRKLVVDSFWGGAFSGHGAVDLLGDKGVDAAIEVLSLDLEDVAALIQPKVKAKPLGLTGVVTGEIRLRGALARPQIAGRLVANDGRFKALDYESIVLNFDGVYPLLQLPEVVITSTEGLSFRVKGVVDLSNLGHLARQVRLFQRVPMVSDQKGRPEWVFKMTSDGTNRTEMKYFLMKDDRGDASAVLGVQKSIGF